MQHAGREFSYHDLVAVGFLQSGNQKLGFYGAVVDEKGLQTPAGAGIGGLGDVAGQGVGFPAAVHLHHPGKVPAIDAVDRRLQSAVSRGGKYLLAVPEELDGNLRVGQRLHLHGGGYPAALHGVGFHEFHPGGGVEKEVADDDGRPFGTADLGFLQNFSRFQLQRRAGHAARRLGQKVDTADGGDGGQCLAPEAHGADGGKVLCAAEFGGGVAEKGRPGVLGGHAAAVVRDPEEGHAAVPNLHGDFGRARVHRVFQKLLDHGRGALHHLAGGDQIGNMRG